MTAISKLLLWGLCAGMSAHAEAASSAAAQSYPTKPIRLIVASSPAGPNDVIARMVSGRWGEALGGRPIVVDNRAGAAGVIGTEIAARAAPDGYTLLLGFQGPLVIAPHLGDTPYDPLKDFAPVSLAVSAPFVLLVHPGVRAKSVKELIALAKARPARLNFASGGTGIGSHLAMELLKFTAGIDMVHVPYKGAGPGLTALVAGEVDAMFAGVSAALPHIKSDKLRPLAVGGDKRFPLLAELPTLSESGFPVNASSWYGVLAPARTPRAIVDRLHATLTQTLTAPQMKSRLTEVAFELNASTPEEFGAFLRSEIATWSKVVRAAGLRVH